MAFQYNIPSVKALLAVSNIMVFLWLEIIIAFLLFFFVAHLGIFKIEDSVEVARLWGLRKNRPAMNYDKLSRSIRQYYRKGIMKKTEVSQRLVYQFVHPC